MSSPLVFLEEQVALRASLAEQVKLMENHLADPQRSPSFGTLKNSEPTTVESIATVKAQIEEIDARIERLRAGNT